MGQCSVRFISMWGLAGIPRASKRMWIFERGNLSPSGESPKTMRPPLSAPKKGRQKTLSSAPEKKRKYRKKTIRNRSDLPELPANKQENNTYHGYKHIKQRTQKIIQEAIRYTYIFLQYMINVMYAISMQGILKRLSWLWVRKCAGIRFSIQTLHPS